MLRSAPYLLFAWILDFSLQVYAQHYTHPDTYVPDTLHYPTIHRTRSCYSSLLLVTTTPLHPFPVPLQTIQRPLLFYDSFDVLALLS